MVRVILHGCNGQMGRVITALAEEDREITIVAGIDVTDEGKNPYPVYRNLQTCSISADVVVDFSVAAAMNSLLDGIEEKKIPAVRQDLRRNSWAGSKSSPERLRSSNPPTCPWASISC